jgi:hypothetical protein
MRLLWPCRRAAIVRLELCWTTEGRQLGVPLRNSTGAILMHSKPPHDHR